MELKKAGFCKLSIEKLVFGQMRLPQLAAHAPATGPFGQARLDGFSHLFVSGKAFPEL